MKVTRLASLVLIAAVAGIARFSFADKIELPARSVTADSQVVVRVDATAITPDQLEKSKTAITAMFGDLAKDSGPSKEEWQQMLDTEKAYANAGAEQLLVIFGTFPQGPNDANSKPTLIVKMKAGSKPEDLEKAIKESDAADAKKNGTEPTMQKVTVKTLEGDWVYLEGDKFSAPAAEGDKKALAAFQESLGVPEGAPLRVALQLNDASKTNFAQIAAGPQQGPPFMKNIAQGLTDLSTANVGIWLGETVKVKLNGTFGSADTAAVFKKGVDSAIAMASVAGMGGDMDPAQAVALKIMTTLLTLKQDGAALSNTADSTTMKDALKDLANPPKRGPADAPADPAKPGDAPNPDKN